MWTPTMKAFLQAADDHIVTDGVTGGTTAFWHRYTAIGMWTAEKVILTPSAVTLLEAVLEDDTRWIARTRPLWVEFAEAQALDYECADGSHKHLGTLRAVHVRNIYDPYILKYFTNPADKAQYTKSLTGFQNIWEVRIFFAPDPAAFPGSRQPPEFIFLLYDTEVDKWAFTGDAWQYCPWQQCKYRYDPEVRSPVTIPCDLCLQTAGSWGAWLRTTNLMLQHYWCTTPKPVPFAEREYTYMERVAQGSGKPKKVPRHATFTVVSFTADQYTVKEPRSEDTETPAEPVPQARNANWLTVWAGTDAIVYELRFIAPHTRKFPRRKDGTRREGVVHVDPVQPRYVPLLRDDRKRKSIITRVKGTH